MKMWITKSALQRGIYEEEVIETKDIFNSVLPIDDKENNSDWISIIRIGVDAFYKKEDAIKKAEEMRLERIETLENMLPNIIKDIEKFKAMKF